MTDSTLSTQYMAHECAHIHKVLSYSILLYIQTMMAMEYLSEGDLHNYLANIREDPA